MIIIITNNMEYTSPNFWIQLFSKEYDTEICKIIKYMKYDTIDIYKRIISNSPAHLLRYNIKLLLYQVYSTLL